MRIDLSRLPIMTPVRECSHKCTRNQKLQKEFNKYQTCLFNPVYALSRSLECSKTSHYVVSAALYVKAVHMQKHRTCETPGCVRNTLCNFPAVIIVYVPKRSVYVPTRSAVVFETICFYFIRSYTFRANPPQFD